MVIPAHYSEGHDSYYLVRYSIERSICYPSYHFLSNRIEMADCRSGHSRAKCSVWWQSKHCPLVRSLFRISRSAEISRCKRVLMRVCVLSWFGTPFQSGLEAEFVLAFSLNCFSSSWNFLFASRVFFRNCSIADSSIITALRTFLLLWAYILALS